jgi:hypothetical protein
MDRPLSLSALSQRDKLTGSNTAARSRGPDVSGPYGGVVAPGSVPSGSTQFPRRLKNAGRLQYFGLSALQTRKSAPRLEGKVLQLIQVQCGLERLIHIV